MDTAPNTPQPANAYQGKHIAIFGASGAIGSACAAQLAQWGAKLTCISRSAPSAKASHHLCADITDEVSLEAAAQQLSQQAQPLDGILITTGMLHQSNYHPEKSIKHLNRETFMRVLEVNTLGPALVAHYFTPLFARQNPVWFAALSARVGSISDNRLGGWYAYRTSKAALNMVIKNLSIELARKHKDSLVVGLHPGTVDSPLSEPFQSGVAPGKLFSPAYSAECLLRVLAQLNPADSGRCFDWAGKEVPA